MRLKVLKSFYDKHTSELYLENYIIDVKKERAQELLNDERELVKKVVTSNVRKS